MKTRYFNVIFISLILVLTGCSGGKSKLDSRTGQNDYANIPLPIFVSIDWPEPFSELPEASLVISGNLECQAGYFYEVPVFLHVFPCALIEPTLAQTATPQMTYEELQQILYANQTVSNWISWVESQIVSRVDEGPTARDYDDPQKLGQAYHLYEGNFNEFNYFDFENGNFRIDFDAVARLKTGDQLLVLCGVDEAGRIAMELNIFTVPLLYPELVFNLNSSSTAFAERITGLGDALSDVLANSGDDRTADIALIHPYIGLYNDAYGEGYKKSKWGDAASDFLVKANTASAFISDPTLKAEYVESAEFIADVYDFFHNIFWLDQIVIKEDNDDLFSIYQSSNQEIIDRLNYYNSEYLLESRGDGVLILTILIYEGEDIFAQIEISSDPGSPLSVSGFISGHTIVYGDYNPSFVQLLAVFENEGFSPPLFI